MTYYFTCQVATKYLLNRRQFLPSQQLLYFSISLLGIFLCSVYICHFSLAEQVDNKNEQFFSILFLLHFIFGVKLSQFGQQLDWLKYNFVPALHTNLTGSMNNKFFKYVVKFAIFDQAISYKLLHDIIFQFLLIFFTISHNMPTISFKFINSLVIKILHLFPLIFILTNQIQFFCLVRWQAGIEMSKWMGVKQNLQNRVKKACISQISQSKHSYFRCASQLFVLLEFIMDNCGQVMQNWSYEIRESCQFLQLFINAIVICHRQQFIYASAVFAHYFQYILHDMSISLTLRTYSKRRHLFLNPKFTPKHMFLIQMLIQTLPIILQTKNSSTMQTNIKININIIQQICFFIIMQYLFTF